MVTIFIRIKKGRTRLKTHNLTFVSDLIIAAISAIAN
jgi:hypothetical protein